MEESPVTIDELLAQYPEGFVVSAAGDVGRIIVFENRLHMLARLYPYVLKDIVFITADMDPVGDSKPAAGGPDGHQNSQDC